MKPVMTKEEAKAWRARWRMMNEITIQEARAQTVEERFRDLEALFASARMFPARRNETRDSEARARWTLLRERYSG